MANTRQFFVPHERLNPIVWLSLSLSGTLPDHLGLIPLLDTYFKCLPVRTTKFDMIHDLRGMGNCAIDSDVV